MSENPDPERLLERAAANVEAGESWRAKNRLRHYLASLPFDRRYALLLGELELAAGEVPTAGRWLWGADSKDPGHQELIGRFLERHPEGDALWRALPGSLRRGIGGCSIPDPLATELRQRGVDPVTRQTQKRTEESRWLRWGCSLLVLVCVVAMVLGFGQLVKALVRWLG